MPVTESSSTTPKVNSREQKAPIGSRWQAHGDSRVFVVVERKPFGKLAIKQEDRFYFGYPNQKELLQNFNRLPEKSKNDSKN